MKSQSSLGGTSTNISLPKPLEKSSSVFSIFIATSNSDQLTISLTHTNIALSPWPRVQANLLPS